LNSKKIKNGKGNPKKPKIKTKKRKTTRKPANQKKTLRKDEKM
jgi:hypothetical protein